MSKETSALVVLRPGEARSLIGQAVASLETVQEKTRSGHMVIVGGSTTRHIIHHLLKEDPGRDTFAVGQIKNALLGETPQSTRGPGPYLFDQGQTSRGWPAPLLEKFGPGDIYIKGANAIDPEGNAAILLGSPVGGSIGVALAILHARGGSLIIPVTLEKLIPSVPRTHGLLGQRANGRVMGNPVGLIPIMAGSATIITELDAMRILANCDATLVAAGGVDDCAGASIIQFQGNVENVEKMWDIILEVQNKNLPDA
ncbi:MAG: hypothetical protein HW380_1639 [Magnetococcales bacterium]|nr:hypothetical protein [Magnetococcales bacterium]HIJ84544.1 hypothetical protein [Magnetococcales bacterium]